MFRILRLLVVLAVAFTSSAVVMAQTGTFASDQAAFDRIGQQVLTEQKAPGFSFLILYRGKVIFANGYGFANVAKKEAVTAGTPFAIGSITKQFTAAAVLLLVQQGKLSLDDPLAKYIPELPNANKITIRMLLNQTSGLHNYPQLSEHPWPLHGTIPPQKLLAILKTDKPDFPPGEKWEYSNTNYTTLAMIVARVSGLSYPDFLQRYIFSPLQMAHSGVGFKAQASAAEPYVGTAGNFHPIPANDILSLDLYLGAGAIVSTAPDLAKWDTALLDGTLLNAKSMHAFWAPGKLANGTPVDYAMGFVPATIGGHREVWHNGYVPDAGGYCMNAIFPDDRLAVVVLSNSPDQTFRGMPEKIVHDVLTVYDPNVPPLPSERKAIAVSPKILAKYVGTYELAPTFDIVITLENGQLVAQATHQPKFHLLAASKTQFFLKEIDAQIEFFTNTDGRVTHLVLHQNGRDTEGIKK